MRLRLGIPFLATALWACGSNSSSGRAPANGSPDGGGTSANDSGVVGLEGDASVPPGDDATVDLDSSSPAPPDARTVDYDQVAPTPAASWVNVTNNLTGKASECGNVSVVFADPRADRLIVGVALDGLFASTDGAMTWNSIGTTGDPIKNRMSAIVFDPTNAGTFWESGIYGWETNAAGVFVTTNNGTSFTGNAGLETTSKGGNTNDSISIDFSDPARKTMLAGTHETKAQLFLSTDTGSTWSDIGPMLPATVGFCTSTLVLDSKTLIVGCAASYSNEAGAILRSTNGGMSFTNVNASGVIGQPLWATDGTLYFAAEGGGIDKSTDQGQTWTLVADKNTAGTVRPIELPDGRIVSAQEKSLVVSADKGVHWTPIGAPMPYVPVGICVLAAPPRVLHLVFHVHRVERRAGRRDCSLRLGLRGGGRVAVGSFFTWSAYMVCDKVTCIHSMRRRISSRFSAGSTRKRDSF